MAYIPQPHSDTLYPPPFILSVNTRQKFHHCHRHISSVGNQVFTGHCFSAGYSLSHRTFADDNITCPCAARHHTNPHYTINHVLSHCPIHNAPRRKYFGNRANLDNILGTESGGRGFAKFIDETSAFFHPLPPRPDPP